jgi:tetratricopeptide (TPR) repeat protein
VPTAAPWAAAEAAAELLLRDDVERALDEAKRSGRPLALFFRSRWSPWAAAMEQRVLNDRRVAEVLKSLVVVRIDSDALPAMADRYGVVEIPVLVIAEPGGRELGRLRGYAGAEQLAQRIPALLEVGIPAERQAVDPSDVEALVREAVKRRGRGDLAGMAEMARRILDVDAENRRGRADNALATLGLLQSRLGNWDEAFRLYSRLLERYPDTELRAHALVALGFAAAQLGRRQDAVEAYELFQREFPGHADSGFVGDQLQRLKRLENRSIGGLALPPEPAAAQLGYLMR